MAQEIGDYFVLIRQYEEAKAEYQDAITAYGLVAAASPEFAEALKNKETVQRNLNELQAGKVPVIKRAERKSDKEEKESVLINGMKYLIHWLSPVWQPHLAGLAPSAADISKKHHSFDTDDGNIKVECYWRSESEDEPAYIWVRWEANITTDKELLIRFVSFDTNQILSEFNMKNFFVGEEAFTTDELGFDPFCENWCIAVALIKPES